MKRFLKFYLFAFIMLSNFIVFAQGEEDENGDLEGDDPQPAPINGKLFILAIMGILFAIYSYKNYKKEA